MKKTTANIILNGERVSKTKKFAFHFHSTSSRDSSQCHKAKKGNKSIQVKKERCKTFFNNLYIYVRGWQTEAVFVN